jgi:NADPH:quinone reductase-like Zn-dependent oxidoreductase/SAM-dependent methyltransferase
MLAAGMSAEEAAAYLEIFAAAHPKSYLCIACINSPRSVTISGNDQAINDLKESLDKDGIFGRKLKVNVAYHSQHMNTIAAEYLLLIGELEHGTMDSARPSPTFYSSLTGTTADIAELQKAEYWIGNLVSPVQFSQAYGLMVSDSGRSSKRGKSVVLTGVLEIGPHAALQGPVREILEQRQKSSDISYQSLLQRGVSATDTVFSAAGWLYCHGHSIDVSAVNAVSQHAASPRLLTNLPSYPFNHAAKYWDETRISKSYRWRPSVRHELLGALVSNCDPSNLVWRNYVRINENPWIEHHKVTGSILYPAAGMLVMAIEASRQVVDPLKTLKGFRIRDAKFSVALQVPSTLDGVETNLHLRPCRDYPATASHTWFEFSLSSYEKNEWREHCRGYIITEYDVASNVVDNGKEAEALEYSRLETFKQVEENCTGETLSQQLYTHLAVSGADFGPTFRTLQDIRFGQLDDLVSTATVTVQRPDLEGIMPHGHLQPHLVHPTVLDGILQTMIVCATKGASVIDHVMVPTEIEDLWLAADASAKYYSLAATCQAKNRGLRDIEASIVVLDKSTGIPTVTVEGYVATAVAKAESAGTEGGARQLCFNVNWKPDTGFIAQDIVNDVFRPEGWANTKVTQNMVDDAEFLCYHYLRQYMAREHTEEIEKNMSWNHVKYLAWIRNMLEKYQAGQIPLAKPEWAEWTVDDEFIAAFEADLTARSAEGKLLVSIGTKLGQILAGEVDALAVLFGEEKLAEDVYHSVIGRESMVAYVGALAHKNPGLSILEVGAGTGSATLPILKALSKEGVAPTFGHYDFTDISIGFFEHAKEMFAEWAGRMSFRAFDLEKNPAEQGFELKQYDVVIASNVIHATKNLETTLQNIRKLMKPGGKIVLHESTNNTMIQVGFAFGLLPGWWLSDEDFRRFSPLITAKEWSTVLKRSGFSGVDLELYDLPDPKYRRISAMVATASGEAESPPDTVTPWHIIVDDTHPLQMDIATRLVKQISLQVSAPAKILSLSDTSLDSDAYKATRHGRVVLLADLESKFLENITETQYSTLQDLVGYVKTLVWVTTGGGPTPKNPDADMVTGFARAMRAENPGLKFLTLSFDSLSSPEASCTSIMRVVSQSTSLTENTFFEKDGVVYIPRILEEGDMDAAITAKTTNQKAIPQRWADTGNRALALSIGAPGLLDTLQFQDDPVYETPLAPDGVEVKVYTVGLNLLDVMIALAQVSGQAFGRECAGVVTRVGKDVDSFKVGDRVSGMIGDLSTGMFKTYARGNKFQFAKIPDSMSFVDAGGIGVVYGTAIYALYDIGRLQKGESVLIHWGSGGLGQAAIQLAKLVEAEIYVTVGSIEKRDFVHKQYGIPLENILSSRDLSFAHGIKRLTKGRGVDVILNSTAGQALRSTWECIAPYGRFIEVGKVDIYSNTKLPMVMFKRNVTFSCVDLASISVERPQIISRLLHDSVRLFTEGKITTPQPLTVFGYSDVQETFRLMQSGTHIGKLVLEVRDDASVPVSHSDIRPR